MDKRLSTSTGLAALLVVFLHMFSGGSDRPADSTPSKKDAASDNSAATQDSAKIFNGEGPWIATQQYFHHVPVAVAAGCQAYLLSSEPIKSVDCDRGALLDFYGFDKDFQSADITALVATVPDPLHTRMSVETDRYLDAIQQAAYRSGWELANQWLPWVLKARGASAAASAPGSDLEKFPGLLVFRRHFTDPDVISEVLLVFVAGETPTAGINGFQWEVARRSLSTLGSADSGRIAVVGPNLSGSFPSLTRLIMADTDFYHYEIHAGSVSNLNYAATMLATLEKRGFLINDCKKGKRSITFHASTLPSRSFKKQFIRLARSWGYEENQLAELIEDESGFAYRNTPEQSDRVVVYRYPRDIAQLRNAYSDVAFANNQKQDSNTAPALEFSLKDTQSGEGNFPIFSTNHTPVSQNAVLEQIVRGLNRKHIRVVNLTATNVFDTIFLAKVLAQYCPDTRIVLSGADLLFVQEAGRSSLAGIMAISPFPMFPEGADWSNPAMHDVTTFADADSVGVYNAALSLLGDDSIVKRQRYQLIHPAFSNDFLSVWLLVLGRSGWLPVDLLRQNNPPLPLQDADSLSGQLPTGPHWFDDHLKSDVPLGPRRALPPVGQGWIALCILVAAVVLGFCARFYYLKKYCRILVWSILCLGDLGRRDRHAAITRIVHLRYLCLIACFALLAFADSILLTPLAAARFVHGSPAGHASLEVIIWAAFLLPLGFAVYLFHLVPLRVCDEGPGSACHSGARLSALVFLLRAAVLVLPIAGAVCWWRCCADGIKGQLVCFRAFTLLPPVSPVWPLLLSAAALFVITFFHLRRFTWADRQQPLLNTALFDESLWNQFGGLKKRLNRILLSPVKVAELSGPSAVVPIMIGSVLLLIVLFPHESLRSFESTSFELLLISMLLLLAVLMTLSFVQFAACWSVVRAFLATLSSVVLGRFFTRLPDFNGSGPIWMREVKVLSLATSVNSSIALHNLHNLTSSRLVKGWRDRYWKALATFLSQEKPQRSRRQFIRNYRIFRQTAAQITDELGRKILQPYWATHEIDPVDAESTADGKGQTRGENKTREAPPPAAQAASRNETHAATASADGASSTTTLTAVAESLPDLPLLNDLPDPVTTEAYELASKYIAMQYAAFIGYALRHLQNLLLCCTICFVLLVLALNSFSFQAPRAISQFVILALVVGAVIVLRVLAQIERDTILSRLSGTEAGELGKDFYLRALAYGGLPVLTVIGTQYPAISHFISAWAQPTLAAMH